MNRLADYLYLLARYADAREQEGRSLSVDSVPGTSVQTEPAVSEEKHPEDPATKVAAEAVRAEHTVTPTETQSSSTGGDTMINEAMIQEVLKRMGIQGRITLDSAKRLIEKIEEEARRRNKPSVIAICGPDGNPIAIHVMDGAFLVSFDVAMKKAYTSVAVKMSTMELSKLAQPGGTFYGLDKMGDGIVIFAGGVPLKVGDTIIGGLGVSGGTGEEDHSLAEYGLQVLKDVL